MIDNFIEKVQERLDFIYVLIILTLFLSNLILSSPLVQAQSRPDWAKKGVYLSYGWCLWEYCPVGEVDSRIEEIKRWAAETLFRFDLTEVDDEKGVFKFTHLPSRSSLNVYYYWENASWSWPVGFPIYFPSDKLKDAPLIEVTIYIKGKPTTYRAYKVAKGPVKDGMEYTYYFHETTHILLLAVYLSTVRPDPFTGKPSRDITVIQLVDTNTLEPIRKKVKGVSLLPQETNYSCWAASSLMILNYYGTYSDKPLTQIELARELGNEEYYSNGIRLHEILPFIGRWEGTLERLGKLDFDRDVSLTFDEVISDINLGRPIMAFIVSQTWGICFLKIPVTLHVVVIVGYIDRPGTAEDEVIIFDPWPPGKGTESIVKWTTFKEKLFTLINGIRTKPQVLEGTILTLQEPQHKIYLHVYDEKGRHVGFNYDKNQIEEEIPNSQYLDLNGTILIILPLNVTSFHCVVDAKYAVAPSENYALIITNIRNGTLTSEYRRSDVIKQGEKREFTVSVLPTEREIKVELVKVPWWQTSLYGIPVYLIITLMVISLLSIVGIKIIKRKVAR